MQATLGEEVEGVGGCSIDGSTRGRVVEERDITRGPLVKGCSDHKRPAGSPTSRQNQQTCLSEEPFIVQTKYIGSTI